jgi:hypothetical protein
VSLTAKYCLQLLLFIDDEMERVVPPYGDPYGKRENVLKKVNL